MRIPPLLPRTLLLLLALLPRLANAECPASLAELSTQIEAGILSSQKFDWKRFDLQRDLVRAEVICLAEAPSPAEVARLHLFEALAAGRIRDARAAEIAFRGVHAILPTYAPPPELVAPGSLLDQAWQAAVGASDAGIQALPGAGWVVDGKQDPPGIPRGRVALVQHVGPGPTPQTWYLRGQPPLPADLVDRMAQLDALAEAPPPAPPPPPEPLPPSPPEPERHPSRVLALSAAGAGLGALSTFLLVSIPTAERYPDEPDLLTAQRTRLLNNASVVGSAGLGAVAGGLLVGAVVRGQW